MTIDEEKALGTDNMLGTEIPLRVVPQKSSIFSCRLCCMNNYTGTYRQRLCKNVYSCHWIYLERLYAVRNTGGGNEYCSCIIFRMFKVQFLAWRYPPLRSQAVSLSTKHMLR
jgi:hypothetical protein